jgi:hypothetical protein
VTSNRPALSRLIQEARAIYEGIFPKEKSAGGEQRGTKE